MTWVNLNDDAQCIDAQVLEIIAMVQNEEIRHFVLTNNKMGNVYLLLVMKVEILSAANSSKAGRG